MKIAFMRPVKVSSYPGRLSCGIDSQNCICTIPVYPGRQQNGWLPASDIDDYINNRVRKHELTAKIKVRSPACETHNAQTGPVFFFIKAALKVLYEEALRIEPAYDCTSGMPPCR
jgi:uncharacterized protein (DUF1015 family)